MAFFKLNANLIIIVEISKNCDKLRDTFLFLLYIFFNFLLYWFPLFYFIEKILGSLTPKKKRSFHCQTDNYEFMYNLNSCNVKKFNFKNWNVFSIILFFIRTYLKRFTYLYIQYCYKAFSFQNFKVVLSLSI